MPQVSELQTPPEPPDPASQAKRSLAHGADINDLQTQKDNVSMNFDVDQAEEVSNCIWATINIWYLAPSRQFLVNVCLFSKFRETVFVVLAFLVCSNVFWWFSIVWSLQVIR